MSEPSPELRPVIGVSRLTDGFTLSGRSILVVEDQPLIAVDIAMTFEDAGANVMIAHNFAEALPLMERTRFSAAVVDVGLSEKEATAFCERLKRASIPFVIYSGNVEAPVNGGVFVPKPASGETLLTSVARLVTTGSGHVSN